MKIRKVDDKPMVIHTKEKAKIHAHEPKGAKIKGSNIYTVERGPKTIGAKVSDDKKSPIARAPFISQSRRIRDYQDSSETLKNQTFPSRPRTPIFTLQEEQEHLQLGQ